MFLSKIDSVVVQAMTILDGGDGNDSRLGTRAIAKGAKRSLCSTCWPTTVLKTAGYWGIWAGVALS